MKLATCIRGGALCALLAPALAQTPSGTKGEVHATRAWTVDATGAGDFLDVQPAIDAAASGDVVIVRAAVARYSSFEIVGKALAIVGEGIPGPAIEGTASVRRVPPGADVVLRNLDLFVFADDGAVLALKRNRGTVWIEDCTVAPYTASSGPGLDGIRIVDCDSVALLRVEIEQPGGQVTGTPAPRTGLEVVRSEVHAYGCTFGGPHGTYEGPTSFQQKGGTGARLEDAFLYASDCVFLGGNGTPSLCELGSCIEAGAAGGDGLVVDASSEVRSVASQTTAGSGAAFLDCGAGSCSGMPDGIPLVNGGIFQDLGVSPRGFSMAPGVATGRSVSLTATGQPADQVYSICAFRTHTLYSSLLSGSELVQPPFDLTFHGFIAPDGTLETAFEVPSLVPLLGFELVFAQGFVFGGGDAFLAGASAVVVLP